MWSYYIDSMNCVQAAVEQNDQIINFEYFLFGLFILFHSFLFFFIRSFCSVLFLSLSLSRLFSVPMVIFNLYTQRTHGSFLISHIKLVGWMVGVYLLLCHSQSDERWARMGLSINIAFQIGCVSCTYNLQLLNCCILCAWSKHGLKYGQTVKRVVDGGKEKGR